jgi:hypothetical protein
MKRRGNNARKYSVRRSTVSWEEVQEFALKLEQVVVRPERQILLAVTPPHLPRHTHARTESA